MQAGAGTGDHRHRSMKYDVNKMIYNLQCFLSTQGEAVLFVVTNFLETPNQKLGYCPEVRILLRVD